jgi:hypothetical protein
MKIKALSIRQPWAWLIVNGYKDIENRSWQTRYRGPVLIHTGRLLGAEEKADCYHVRKKFGIDVPSSFDLGGIVGIATIIDCVDHSRSPWFNGPFGFVLVKVQPLPWFPLRGALGFFDVPDDILNMYKLQTQPKE